MLFVPLWLTFSYSVGACSTWSDQTFLQQKEEFIDLARAYVSHSSIIWCCWFTVVHWVIFANPYTNSFLYPQLILIGIPNTRVVDLYAQKPKNNMCQLGKSTGFNFCCDRVCLRPLELHSPLYKKE